MSAVTALGNAKPLGQPSFFSAYIDDLGEYIDRTATRVTKQGPFGVIGGLLSGRINSFSKFKDALKSSVSAVWQTIKEATAWATVGLSIANERLGKLAWAILPDSFKDPLPEVVKDHMESPFGKLIEELMDQVNPRAETPKDDMRRKVHLRRALRQWRNGEQPEAEPVAKATGAKAAGAKTPKQSVGLMMGPA